jgi:hypothetical protein
LSYLDTAGGRCIAIDRDGRRDASACDIQVDEQHLASAAMTMATRGHGTAVIYAGRLEEVGEQGGGAGGAVGGNGAVVDVAADLGGDGGGDVGRARVLVVHVLPGAVALEPVADVEVLLEVVAERELQERPLAGGQLHGGGEPALDDREVASG